MTEAKWLWAAEKKQVPQTEQGTMPSSVAEPWGSVAMLLRPGSSIQPLSNMSLTKPAGGIPQQLLDRWSHLARAGDHELMITDRGILDIAWPHRVDGMGDIPLDLLLATTNRPTDQGNTSALSIANAWNAAPDFRKYFDANQQSGILTFQDHEIIQHLS